MKKSLMIICVFVAVTMMMAGCSKKEVGEPTKYYKIIMTEKGLESLETKYKKNSDKSNFVVVGKHFEKITVTMYLTEIEKLEMENDPEIIKIEVKGLFYPT